MASVTIEHVSKRFGSFEAVSDLNLSIRDGEFMSLLGPSGCGKTTTLNMIAGLETPGSGAIRIGERDVTHLPAMHRDVAMVFQSYALYPHMTVARNMGFALKIRGVAEAEIAARVKQAAGMLSLETVLDRYPKQLSGGQRQRVALGRALVRSPQVCLLDEPLSNLDAVLRTQTRAELSRLFKTVNTTAIYVTHDQSEAMTMSDRIAVFSHGRLQQVGEPLDIYRSPANRFVAAFVGSPAMTFLDAVCTDAGALAVGELRFGCPVGAPGLAPGKRVTIGLRPEDVSIGAAGERSVVEIVEHLGSLQIIHVRAAGHRILAQVADTDTIRRGDALMISVKPHNLYLFSADTEQALYTPGRDSLAPSSFVESRL
jgi:ABC-type sugar transport system ATPase subunit